MLQSTLCWASTMSFGLTWADPEIKRSFSLYSTVNENRALSQYRCSVIFMNPVKSDPRIENAEINNRADFKRKE